MNRTEHPGQLLSPQPELGFGGVAFGDVPGVEYDATHRRVVEHVDSHRLEAERLAAGVDDPQLDRFVGTAGPGQHLLQGLEGEPGVVGVEQREDTAFGIEPLRISGQTGPGLARVEPRAVPVENGDDIR